MNDDQKHAQVDTANEETADVEDIDKTQESVGLPSDDKGPKELNSAQVIEDADKNQE